MSDPPTTSSEQIIGTRYIVTLQGICKIVEIVASFIAVLLVGIQFYGSPVQFFESAAALSIIFAVLMLVLYTTTFIVKIPLSWNRIQFFWNAVLAIYYIIAASVVLDKGGHWNRILAGGIIAFIAIAAHMVDAFDNYRKHPLH